jgi:hypothetical protein
MHVCRVSDSYTSRTLVYLYWRRRLTRGTVIRQCSRPDVREVLVYDAISVWHITAALRRCFARQKVLHFSLMPASKRKLTVNGFTHSLTHSQALQPMQGLGRLNKSPPTISVPGFDPPIRPETLPWSSPFSVFVSSEAHSLSFRNRHFLQG